MNPLEPNVASDRSSAVRTDTPSPGEMVERVAAAILHKRYEQQGGRFATNPEDDLALARAAIEAMRIHTQAMNDAAKPFRKGVGETAERLYRAMIDAALTPQEVEG